jgi:hypothetical protein
MSTQTISAIYPRGNAAGNMTGPVGATADNFLIFNGITGQACKDSGVNIAYFAGSNVSTDLANHTAANAFAAHNGLGTAAANAIADFAPAQTVIDLANHAAANGTAVHGLGTASIVNSNAFANAVDFSNHTSANAFAAHNGLGTAAANASGDFAANTDARLSDARTPVGTTLLSGQVFVGNAANLANSVAISGDITLAANGLTTLVNSGVVAGNYTNLNATIAANGSVIFASNGTGGNGTGNASNSFSMIYTAVGNITATSSSDTLSILAGNNCTLSANSLTKIITINANGTSGNFANATDLANHVAANGTAVHGLGSIAIQSANALVFASANATITGGNVNPAAVIIQNAVGAPNISSLTDYIANTKSAGRLTGGVLAAVANGTCNVSEMQGCIFTTNAQGANYIIFKKAAVSGITPTDNAVSWIYMDYANGAFNYATTTTRASVNEFNQFVVGRCWRAGNSVEVITTGMNVYNKDRKIQDRNLNKYGNMDHASGCILSASGTGVRTLSVTEGSWYTGDTNFITAALDTGTTGVFHTFYRSAVNTWTESSNLTQCPNTQYNRLSDNTLQNLVSAQRGVYWVFVCPEGDLYLVYGQAAYTSAQAIAATVPTVLPPYVVNWARLCGKIIIQRITDTFDSVESAFLSTFTQATATWHPDLGGRSEADQHPLASITGAGNMAALTANAATVSSLLDLLA